jgi:hypothetical protein
MRGNSATLIDPNSTPAETALLVIFEKTMTKSLGDGTITATS